MGVGGDLVIVGVIKFEGNGRNHIGRERTSRSLSHADWVRRIQRSVGSPATTGLLT
jgi:hypothetical protein